MKKLLALILCICLSFILISTVLAITIQPQINASLETNGDVETKTDIEIGADVETKADVETESETKSDTVPDFKPPYQGGGGALIVPYYSFALKAICFETNYNGRNEYPQNGIVYAVLPAHSTYESLWKRLQESTDCCCTQDEMILDKLNDNNEVRTGSTICFKEGAFFDDYNGTVVVWGDIGGGEDYDCGDGNIDIVDLVKMRSIIIGNKVEDLIENHYIIYQACRMNNDADIDIQDVAILRNRIIHQN